MTEMSMFLVRALVVGLASAGIDRAQFLAKAGLRGRKLDDAFARIPFDDYERVVRAAYESSGDPAFGLHLGERLGAGSFDVLGHLTEHSGSLREAILALVRYSGFVSQSPRLEFVEQKDFATLRFRLPENESMAAQLASEFSTVMMLRLIRSFVGDAALPRLAFFGHAKPAHVAEYHRFFGGREQFSHEFTGLEFDRNWLDLSLPYPGTELHRHLINRAELLLSRAVTNVSTIVRVKGWLSAQPELSRPTLEGAARDLSMSTRTLRRHLHDEGSLFSELVEQSRAAQAKRTLADSERTIQEIAHELGFRTASAFSRAFKRWTGKNPRGYRSSRQRT